MPDRCMPPYAPRLFFEKLRITSEPLICSNDFIIVILCVGCRPLFLNTTAKTGKT